MSVIEASTTPTNMAVLGQVLDQTNIIDTSPDTSAALTNIAIPPTSIEGRKSPKKRERTDSMKQLYESPPTAQRARQTSSTSVDEAGDGEDGDEEEEDMTDGLSSEMVVPINDPLPQPYVLMNAIRKGSHKEKSNPRRWSKQEDQSLKDAVDRSGERNWKAIAEQVPGRNHTQCLQRWTKVLKPGLIKGHWDADEDAKLKELVSDGKRNWGQIASLIPGRTSKQCRERWCNHLDPNINKGVYTEKEDQLIIGMQAKLGNRWSVIAQQLQGRTEDAVKIRWKSLMRGKKLNMNDGGEMSTRKMVPSNSVGDSNALHHKAPRITTLKKGNVPSPRTLNPTIVHTPHLFNTNQVIRRQTSKGNNHTIDPKDVASSINSYMENNLVAASIHNFKIQQPFNGTTAIPPTTTALMSSVASHPSYLPSTEPIDPSQTTVYPLAQQTYNLPTYPMAVNTINMNTSTGQRLGPYEMMMQAASFSTYPPQHMLQVQGRPMSIASSQTYPTHSISMAPATFTSGYPPPSNTVNLIQTHVQPTTSLSTPREEWGSSQTTPPPFIMEDGHTSTYDLFHQQRLRLMVAERDKGMVLTSAPSPGQALLTKELKANKERQKRQEMMQKTGWKSAVEAMISLHHDSPSMEGSEALMDPSKVDLDPTEHVLMDTTVDMNLPTDDTAVVDVDEDPTISEHESTNDSSILL